MNFEVGKTTWIHSDRARARLWNEFRRCKLQSMDGDDHVLSRVGLTDDSASSGHWSWIWWQCHGSDSLTAQKTSMWPPRRCEQSTVPSFQRRVDGAYSPMLELWETFQTRPRERTMRSVPSVGQTGSCLCSTRHRWARTEQMLFPPRYFAVVASMNAWPRIVTVDGVVAEDQCCTIRAITAGDLWVGRVQRLYRENRVCGPLSRPRSWLGHMPQRSCKGYIMVLDWET